MSDFPAQTQLSRPSIDSVADAAYAVDEASFGDHNNATSLSSEAPLPSPHVAGGRKRKSTRGKGAKQLSRSTSTPQLGNEAMSDSEDKKRNKLGYQRISIACAHCRRRKIRCVLADADPQQRCQNCIRLKKECVFYPVDQQAAMETRGESAGKSIQPSGPSSIVSSSPSNHGLERAYDSGRDFPPFSSLPSNAPPRFPQGLGLESSSTLPAQGMYAQSDYSYRATQETRQWSQAQSLGSNASPTGGDSEGSTSGLSRYPTAPASGGDFSPFPSQDGMHAPQYPQSATQYDFPQQRENMLWQQPLRSMSHGNLDHLSSQYTGYGMQPPPIQRPQQMSPHYATSLGIQSQIPTLSQAPTPADLSGRAVDASGLAYNRPHGFAFEPGAGHMENLAAPRAQNYAGSWPYEQQGYGSMAEEPETYSTSKPG